MLLLPSAVVALEEDDYIYDCQVQYSITLAATYVDSVYVPPCSEQEMGAIHDLAVGVVGRELISSLLGTSLPEFLLGWESYETGALVTQGAPIPTPEDITAQMTDADIVVQLQHEGCGDDNPLCEGIDSDADDEEAGRRQLMEVTPQEPASAEREWTPLKHLEEQNRGLQSINCPTSESGCASSGWCCTWCSICSRRRRNLKKKSGCSTVRTKGESKADKKAKNAIKRFERRVSSDILKELKALAIQGQMKDPAMYTCLGIPSKLYVNFDRHFFEEMCDDEDESTP